MIDMSEPRDFAIWRRVPEPTEGSHVRASDGAYVVRVGTASFDPVVVKAGYMKWPWIIRGDATWQVATPRFTRTADMFEALAEVDMYIGDDDCEPFVVVNAVFEPQDGDGE